MTIYSGRRIRPVPGGRGYALVRKNKAVFHAGRSQKVYNHSPDGFEWGYCGSGPAQLALAILLEETTEANALAHYEEFKREKIATLTEDEPWIITSEDVAAWLAPRIKPAILREEFADEAE